jgi:hypothetical protein
MRNALKNFSLSIIILLLGVSAATTTHVNPKNKAWDHNGNPLVGGLLWSYQVATSTKANTYSDPACTIPNTNPVVLDSQGEASVYIRGSVKLVQDTALVTGGHGSLFFTINEASGGIPWTFNPASAGVLYSSVVYGGTQAILQAAITAVGSSEATLYLAPAKWLITSDLIIPANITLKLERGALFAVTTGNTVTFNGGLDAGLYQIFSCTGTGRVLLTGGKVTTINAAWWGNDRNAIQAAINAYTTSTPAYQTAVPRVLIPAGEWDITSCLDATNRWDIYLAGDAPGADFLRGTILRGNSGPGKAVIDFVGTRVRLENIAISTAGAATPSTIGIIMGASSTATAISNYLSNVAIDMESSLTANNNMGTIGLINDCAEQTTYNRVYSNANLPLLITTEHALAWIPGHTFTVSSEYATMGSTRHNGVHEFFGTSLIQLNYYRPALAVAGQNINLGNAFLGQRVLGGPTGTYHKGVLCGYVNGFTFKGEMEYINTAFDIVGPFINFDVNMLLTPYAGTDAMITVNTNSEIGQGKCNINLPQPLVTANRKYLDATVTTGTAWSGVINNCDFITNLQQISEVGLVAEAIANKWASGSLTWTGGKSEFFANVGGVVQKIAFGASLGTFTSPAGLEITSNVFTIAKPATEAANHNAGTITCKMRGHITTGGDSATEIASLPFEATFTIAIKDDGGIHISDAVAGGNAQADQTVFTAATSGAVTLRLTRIDLLNPTGDYVQVKPIVSGGGASINGKTCSIVGQAEFYISGFHTRKPSIYTY